MIKSEKLYSVSDYLKLVTGKFYTSLFTKDDFAFIKEVLGENKLCLWNYPLSEIDHIFENDIDVVLVNCITYNDAKDKFIHTLRWFEVPEGVVICD